MDFIRLRSSSPKPYLKKLVACFPLENVEYTRSYFLPLWRMILKICLDVLCTVCIQRSSGWLSLSFVVLLLNESSCQSSIHNLDKWYSFNKISVTIYTNSSNNDIDRGRLTITMLSSSRKRLSFLSVSIMFLYMWCVYRSNLAFSQLTFDSYI